MTDTAPMEPHCFHCSEPGAPRKHWAAASIALLRDAETLARTTHDTALLAWLRPAVHEVEAATAARAEAPPR